MPSSYTTSARFTKQGVGENDDTWGIIADGVYDLIDDNINGVVTINVTTGDDITLTVENGSSDQSRKAVLKLSGTPIADIDIIAPAVPKKYVVDGSLLAGSFTVTVKPTGGGDGVVFSAGEKGIVYCDGTDMIEILKTLQLGALAEKDTVAATDIDSNAITTAKIADSNVTLAKIQNIATSKLLGNVSGISAAPAEITLDNDDTLAGDSASRVPTQAAVKGYVDTVVPSNLALAKGFVIFTKDTTPTVYASYGVTSVVKVTTGTYDITWDTTFGSKNKMGVIVMGNNNNGYNGSIHFGVDKNNSTTSKTRIISIYAEDNGFGYTQSLNDRDYYMVWLFGDET